MDAAFERDYTYYQRTLAQAQVEADTANEWLGFPRVDLAYAKAMERAQRRAMPTSEAMLREFRVHIQTQRYIKAVWYGQVYDSDIEDLSV